MRKPVVLVACVGGVFQKLWGFSHEFVNDKDIRLIGVEAAGFGLDSGKHVATLTKAEVGVLHGAMSSLLQDEDGQIFEYHSSHLSRASMETTSACFIFP